jgi:ribosomal protein L18E
VARKPSDIVSPNLRIREDLRRRLEKAAKKNRVSINREMINRLTDSFELKAQFSLEELASHMKDTWERTERATSHHSDLQAALINAAEALVAANEKQDQAAITTAVDQVKAAITTIELDRHAALRKRV